MKILHISAGFSIDFQGGITNYVRNIALEQARNGNEVWILADSGSEQAYKLFCPATRIKPFSFAHKCDLKNYSQIEGFIQDEDFDLIHIHMMLNVDQRLYRIIKQYKYIISLHDYYYICPRIIMKHGHSIRCEKANTEKCEQCFSVLDYNNLYYRAIRKLFGEAFADRFPIKARSIYRKWITNLKPLLEGAKLLIPVSNRVMEIYQQSGIQNNYRVLHIGNMSALDFNDKYQYKHNDSINIVVLSSVAEYKGGNLLCKLIKETNNKLLKVHFYGRANAEQAQMLEEAGIINHGAYKQNELKEILSNVDLGMVLPIWEDNAPQVVMEMLNNHVPVFATKMGGITDFVNENNGYTFDPFNPIDIENAIEFLNNLNFNDIERMKKSIKRTTTPEEHYLKLMDVYKEVLK